MTLAGENGLISHVTIPHRVERQMRRLSQKEVKNTLEPIKFAESFPLLALIFRYFRIRIKIAYIR